MCSTDSSLWCWDATTQGATDEAPSQRRSWKGFLSFSFKVRACLGRVTLPCKSLRGVRAPNTTRYAMHPVTLDLSFPLSVFKCLKYYGPSSDSLASTRIWCPKLSPHILCEHDPVRPTAATYRQLYDLSQWYWCLALGRHYPCGHR